MRQKLAWVLIAFALTGCATGGRVDAPEVRAAPAPATDRLAIRPGEGLGGLRFGSTQDAVRDAFGEPDRKSGPSAWEYLSHGLAVVFEREGRVRAVLAGDGCLRGDPPAVSPLVDAFKGKTAKGVGMRSPRADVEAEFGAPDREQKREDFVILSYGELGLSFTFFKDELIYITMKPPATGR